MPASDEFPALANAQGYWGAESDPAQQINFLEGESHDIVPPPSTTAPPIAGFTPMLWSDAEYYGLNTASLQNAAGEFTAPSQSSLYASVADASQNANGTITPNYQDTSDPSAYAMPVVIYAVVPNGSLSQGDLTDVQSMLNSLVATSDDPTSDLPPGFVQLPSSLYTQATAAISNLTAAPSVPSPVPASTSGGKGGVGGSSAPGKAPSAGASGAPTAPPTPNSESGSADVLGFSGLLRRGTGLALQGLLRPGRRAGGARARFRLTACRSVTRTIALVAESTSWLQPGLTLALCLSLLLGPGLLLVVGLRRKQMRPSAVGTTPVSGDGLAEPLVESPDGSA